MKKILFILVYALIIGALWIAFDLPEDTFWKVCILINLAYLGGALYDPLTEN